MPPSSPTATPSTSAPLITAEGMEELRTELADLEIRGRSEISAQLKAAAADGDLSENAEYHAVRDAQAHLETRIAQLSARLRDSKVVSAENNKSGVVGFGSKVTFVFEKSGASQTFRIVSSRDAKPTEGTLSSESPVARALSGHRVGEIVPVQTPSGARNLRITKIS